MKVFFSLIVFSLVLATCQGACLQGLFEAKLIDGKPVMPNACVDIYDNKKHLLGSTWNTDHCYRYGGIGNVEGCKTVVNPVTCQYESYRLDDPSQHC
ncbi:hypothetical protein Chor_002219 [Crotalus horridus]